MVPDRVGLVKQQRAQRHRGQQLARLDDHFDRERDPAERNVAGDERGKDQNRDAQQLPEGRPRAVAAKDGQVDHREARAHAKLEGSHDERRLRLAGRQCSGQG